MFTGEEDERVECLFLPAQMEDIEKEIWFVAMM